MYDGSGIELNDDLMYNCPNCNSNYCEPYVEPVEEGMGLNDFT